MRFQTWPIAGIFFLLLLIAWAGQSAAQVTVLVPSAPEIEKKGKDLEVDMLMTLMYPFKNQTIPMDMPQMFASLRFKNDSDQPERQDLLGDVEEIRYLGQKAWGANIALEKAGLYQFIMESRPWWNEANNHYLQQVCKVILPVLDQGEGWNVPAGLGFEIVPLTRPFGLYAPVVFSGRALLSGKPQVNIPVCMGRINIEKKNVLTPWHEKLAARTNQAGEFTFVLPRPGWWYCEAIIPGDPLKGPDGEMKPMDFGSILWLYVDGNDNGRKK